MDNCCNKCFQDCDSIGNCPESFILYIPQPYEEDTITVKITNGQGFEVLQSGLTVEAGTWVELDLTTFPDGFLSPYGGPYKIEFFLPTTGAKISFVASDGLTYLCLSFTVANQTGGDGVVYVNAISTLVPEPY